jgi:predicted Zn-dependent peptidase
MGADIAKIGERQMMVFRFECVNDRFAPRKINALEKSIQFLWKILSQPVTAKGGLRADYVAQEKENLKRLIEGMINERMSYAYERCIQEMCKDEAYARYEYGRLDEIEAITPKDLLKLHERLLAEAPIDLFVSGDVDPKKVVAIAKKTFKFRKRKLRSIPPTEVRSGNGDAQEHIERIDVEQGKMVLGLPHGRHLGQPETFPLVMYNGLLGAFPHSKLFANVREKEGLAYAVHSSLDTPRGCSSSPRASTRRSTRSASRSSSCRWRTSRPGKISDDEWDKTRLTISDRVRSARTTLRQDRLVPRDEPEREAR